MVPPPSEPCWKACAIRWTTPPWRVRTSPLTAGAWQPFRRCPMVSGAREHKGQSGDGVEVGFDACWRLSVHREPVRTRRTWPRFPGEIDGSRQNAVLVRVSMPAPVSGSFRRLATACTVRRGDVARVLIVRDSVACVRMAALRLSASRYPTSPVHWGRGTCTQKCRRGGTEQR